MEASPTTRPEVVRTSASARAILFIGTPPTGYSDSGPARCWGCREVGPGLTSPNAIPQLGLARATIARENGWGCRGSGVGPNQPQRDTPTQGQLRHERSQAIIAATAIG